MNKILDVVEDIKQNITDNQYKTITESLMEINNNGNKLPLLTNNHKLNKMVYLFNWLDTKLEITNDSHDSINRKELYKYIMENHRGSYFPNDLIKLYFRFSTKEQCDYNEFKYIKYRS